MQSDIVEEWRDVVGYEGRYTVSNFGKVRSSDTLRLGGRALKTDISSKYHRVTLYGADGSRRRWFVHVLVAAAFIGPRPLLYQVNHIDANKLNPSLENLEYVTVSQNSLHSYYVTKTHPMGDRHPLRINPSLAARGDRNGARMYPERVVKGEDSHLSKITEANVLSIRSRYVFRKTTANQLAKEFGLHRTTVEKILHRKLWKHI